LRSGTNPAERAVLAKRLHLPEALALSLAVIAPTVTAAFNITLVVQSAGPAAPLAFAIGMVAMGLVAVSFMAFAHRVSHAGSAYAYIAHTFGQRAGFIAGWTLLLTYLGFATGFAPLVGSFAAAALRGLGVTWGPLWLVVAAGSLLLAWWLAYRDMRLAGRVMLVLEGAAIVAILGLCVAILAHSHPSASSVRDSFHPSSAYHGWVGLGFGMVFTVLSYAGFEGAATLGEETVDPKRNIPIALLATVFGSGLFFIFVVYCELVGFGAQGLKALATSQAPLDDLALRYASPRLAVLLDAAAATSCFSGVLGGLSAAGRILFALGRAGLSPRLARVSPVHHTPAVALGLGALGMLAVVLAGAAFVSAGDFYSYASTIATLALILIYIGVGTAEAVEAWREQRRAWSLTCLLGPMLLLWVLYRNVYPVPEYPNNLWPYVALAWVMAAPVLIRMNPRLADARLPEYQLP
jgi:amino acid transporter